MMIHMLQTLSVTWRMLRLEGSSPRVDHFIGEASETFHVHAATVSALSCARAGLRLLRVYDWCVLVVSSVGEHSLTSSVVWVQRRRRDGLKFGR
jgi:hypothetical protein